MRRFIVAGLFSVLAAGCALATETPADDRPNLPDGLVGFDLLQDAGDVAGDMTPNDVSPDLVDAEEGDSADVGLCPSDTLRCVDDTVDRCTMDIWVVEERCPLGCQPGENRCAQFTPSFGIEPGWMQAGTSALTPTEDIIINTNQGSIIQVSDGMPLPGVVVNTTGAMPCGAATPLTKPIAVFSFTDVNIPEGVEVIVLGGPALAILASGRINISGVVAAQAGITTCQTANCGGAGGFIGGLAANPNNSGNGPSPGQPGFSRADSIGDESGGGGGGSCGSGLAGGSAGMSYPGGPGGMGTGSAEVTGLCGGSGGGAGGPGSFFAPTDPGSHGGGGGSAIYVASLLGITVQSTDPALPTGINAGGAGGNPDTLTFVDDGGGGGGGGGTIVLEAPSVSLTADAVLAANGGGGGGGYNGGQVGRRGRDGQLDATPAPGGVGFLSGGAGGAGTSINGTRGQGGSDGAAGGGGGVGRISIRTVDGQWDNQGLVSPSQNSVCFGLSAIQTQ